MSPFLTKQEKADVGPVRLWNFPVGLGQCRRQHWDTDLLQMPSWAEHEPLISFQTYSSVHCFFMKTPLLIKIASLKLQSSVEHI